MIGPGCCAVNHQVEAQDGICCICVQAPGPHPQQNVRAQRAEKVQEPLALTVLQADEGLLFGDASDLRFEQVEAKVDAIIDIEYWKALSEKDEKYLGMHEKTIHVPENHVVSWQACESTWMRTSTSGRAPASVP